MSTRASTVVSRWDRILLVGVAFLTVVTGFFAVRAFTSADRTACRGANEAKAAVQSVVDYLNDASPPTPEARAKADELNRGVRTLLAARKC